MQLTPGIFIWFGYPIEMKRRMAMLHEAGFGRIMLWWGDTDSERKDAAPKKQALDATAEGLTIENAHLPYKGVGSIWYDTSEGDDYIRHLSRSVAECADSGINTVIMHISEGNEELYIPNSYGLKRLERLLNTCDKNKVRLCFENLLDNDCLIQLLDELPSAYMCWDSGHELCYGKGVDFTERYSRRIAAMHLHDNDGNRDLHLIPGDGVIGSDNLSKKLLRLAPELPICLEIMGGRGIYERVRPEAFLQKAYSAACSLGFCNIK